MAVAVASAAVVGAMKVMALAGELVVAVAVLVLVAF